ncbi:hypothetical protein ABFS82_14G023000 [Erythranthe guttata]|uniref:pentatricopeptide repeat-containing protein At1g63330-like n=1 Tax=Erythranthe guttata TaxID=4155 RepID=UPI00064E1394|nr:PREDICTED: pentatricopeptide repeat-containing protein At1g63330-like [Erythranthe guttata]|eukprot:XP_012843101.1 PREDICTED: pentatricopeptide repeat-containing protein At1g63330-like [Erythranthe guttata]
MRQIQKCKTSKPLSSLFRTPPPNQISDPTTAIDNASNKNNKKPSPLSSLFRNPRRNPAPRSKSTTGKINTSSNSNNSAPNYQKIFEQYVMKHCVHGKNTLSDARSVFSELIRMEPLPPNFMFNYILGFVSKNGWFADVFLLYRKMSVLGIPPNLFTLNVVMHCCACLKEARSGWCLLGQMIKRGLGINDATVQFLVKGLCSCGEAMVALQAFDKMSQQEGVEVKDLRYGILIVELCRAGKVDLAIELLHRMVEKGCYSSLLMYNKIMYTLCCEGRAGEAVIFFEKMLEKGISPHAVPYCSLIVGFCKLGEFTEVVRYFDQMVRLGISPNEYNYSSLIQGFCQFNLLEGAVKALIYMKQTGVISPGVVAFGILVDHLCKQGKEGETRELANQMIEYGTECGVATYNSLIYGLCLSDSCLDDAKDLFKPTEDRCTIDKGSTISAIDNATAMFSQILGEDLKPTNATCRALIGGLFDAKKIRAATRFFNEMQLSSPSPSPDSGFYKVMINGFCKNGLIEEALKLYSNFEREGFEPSIELSSILVNGLCSAGRLEEATKMFDEMPDKSLVPDLVVYNLKINGLCKKGKLSEANDLLLEMEEKGSSPDSVSFSTIILSFLERNDTDNAIRLLEDMRSRNLKPNETVASLIKDGKFKSALELMKN